jgi:ABC-type dipeptide/oligopeptide/nickel transport system permease subunit
MTTATVDTAPRYPVLTRLRRDRRALMALPVLLLLVLATATKPFLGDWVSDTDTDELLAGPSTRHLLGTDELGRDVLARYRGGWVDALVMRTADGLIAFPLLVLALTVVAAIGPGLVNALIAIAIVTTPRFARVVRGEVLSLRTREWVAAARIVGVPERQIMRRHLLPHLAGTLLVFAALQVSTAIMAEAALSFLGLSVQPPQPSWGAMVASGTDHLNSTWALSVFPGLAILVTVAAFNLLADAMRDALDAHRPELSAPR